MLYNKAIIQNNYYVKYVKDSSINPQKMTATYIIFTKTKIHKYIIQTQLLANTDLLEFINSLKSIIDIKQWKIMNKTNKVSSHFFIIYPINKIGFLQMDLLLYFGKIEWHTNLYDLIEISPCSICTYINFYTSQKYYPLVKYFDCYSGMLFRFNNFDINNLQSDLEKININKNDFINICNKFKQRLYTYFKSIKIIKPQLI